MLVDIAKARVEIVNGPTLTGRFLLRDGRAAVWETDIDTMTGHRIAWGEGATFSRRTSARDPHIVTFTDGSIWHVRQIAGGCGCGGRNPLGQHTIDELLSPDFATI